PRAWDLEPPTLMAMTAATAMAAAPHRAATHVRRLPAPVGDSSAAGSATPQKASSWFGAPPAAAGRHGTPAAVAAGPGTPQNESSSLGPAPASAGGSGAAAGPAAGPGTPRRESSPLGVCSPWLDGAGLRQKASSSSRVGFWSIVVLLVKLVGPRSSRSGEVVEGPATDATGRAAVGAGG